MSNLQITEQEDCTIQLEIFEGPLDLLLHLIHQQEIDLYDIPIARVTDQYLKYLEMMKDLNVTIAGDFLLMAATLIYMKSCMLLPAEPDSQIQEEIEVMQRDLVDQLIEHEKFKSAAQMLHDRETIELSVWPRINNEFESEEQELVSVDVFDLIRTFHKMAERYKKQIVIEIESESVTVKEKIDEIRRLLKVQSEFLFSIFFERKLSRLHLVMTLFALLELVRLSEIRLLQKGMFEDIRVLAC